MTSNNVIAFPKQSKRAEAAVDLEAIQQNVDMMKHYHIQETIATMVPMIFTQLEIAGFLLDEDEDSEESIKEGAFLVEALRALMLRRYEMHHPFQIIADNVFTAENAEEGTLRIVDELILNLSKNK